MSTCNFSKGYGIHVHICYSQDSLQPFSRWADLDDVTKNVMLIGVGHEIFNLHLRVCQMEPGGGGGSYVLQPPHFMEISRIYLKSYLITSISAGLLTVCETFPRTIIEKKKYQEKSFMIHFNNRRIRLTCLHPCCHPIQIT